MSSRDKRDALRRGFTLLEAAAALVVIGISSVAAMAALGAQTRAAARIDHALVAEALGVERLTTLRLLPREQLERLPASIARGVFAPAFDGYRWNASTSLVRGEQDLFEIRLVVSWESGSYAFATRHYSPRVHLRGR